MDSMPILLAGLVALVVALTFWSITLVIIALWASCQLLVRVVIPSLAAWQKSRPPRAPRPPKPLKPIVRTPRPVQEGYLRRWTFARRMEDAREHDQWQELFDRSLR
jgi:hypothetical protein